jgi:hypothetical protein
MDWPARPAKPRHHSGISRPLKRKRPTSWTDVGRNPEPGCSSPSCPFPVAAAHASLAMTHPPLGIRNSGELRESTRPAYSRNVHHPPPLARSPEGPDPPLPALPARTRHSLPTFIITGGLATGGLNLRNLRVNWAARARDAPARYTFDVPIDVAPPACDSSGAVTYPWRKRHNPTQPRS